MNLKKLLELHERARADGAGYSKRRGLYQHLIHDAGKHFVGIAGPRGAGKTILLRQYAKEHEDAFYLSADVLEPGDDLCAVIKTLREHYRFTTFLLDEIHFLTGYAAALKQLFDFHDVRVFFTSSVALSLHESAHDLSRRVRILNLRPFSFREYLRFTDGLELPKLDIHALLQGEWTPEHLRAGFRFRDYLTGGLLPYSLDEPEPLPLLSNIVEKVIVRDIPAVLRLTLDELELIRRLLKFIGRATVDGINYSSLSRNIGITKYKAEQYVSCLERAFVLHRVLPAGSNVLKEPKVLMVPPGRLLFRDYQTAIGGLREDFLAEVMSDAGIPYRYLKSTRGAKTPDYLIEAGGEKLVLEIGGKGKGRQQFKGIKADRKLIFAQIDTPERNRLPLFLLGYLS